MPGSRDDQFDEATTGPAGDSGDEKTTPFGAAPAQDTDEVTAPYSTTPLSHTASPPPPSQSDTARLKPLAARYDLLNEVGRGGMGVVYRARDRETGDVLALKVLLPEIAADREVVERFKSELLLARKVTHKNVCRVYDLARFGDLAVISMEYIEGESLRAILRRKQGIALRNGLSWARQICSALAEAHSQGVVHRDLKPENILLTHEGAVKVMDFGIARSLETSAHQTGGLILGTPAYMSPEQAQGRPAGHRSDVYSLGLILYEIFTGRPAFTAENATAVLHKQIHETPVAPRAVDAQLPRFLERTIQSALAKDPAKRCASVAELEAGLAEPPAAVAPSELVPPAHLRVWRNADAVLVFVAILSLAYFLNARGKVFPAGELKLEVDAISVRREFQSLSQELKHPQVAIVDVGLVSSPQDNREYNAFLFNRYSGLANQAPASRPSARYTVLEPPLYWRVRFRPLLSSDAEGTTLYDRRGKLQEFVAIPPAQNVPANYQAPPVEKRRDLARAILSRHCGDAPLPQRYVETLGGISSSKYTITWEQFTHDGRFAPAAEVALVLEGISRIQCPISKEKLNVQETAGERFALHVFGQFALWLLLWLVVLLLVVFVANKTHENKLFWRRTPWAVGICVAGIWVLVPGFVADALPVATLLLTALALSGLLLVILTAAEQQLHIHAPERAATYSAVLDLRPWNRAIGLAVLRGACIGLIFAALETAVAHVSLGMAAGAGPPSSGGSMRAWLMILGGLVWPGPANYALASGSPALFTVASAVVHAVLLGGIVIGQATAEETQRRKKMALRKKNLADGLFVALERFGFAAMLCVVIYGLRLHFLNFTAAGGLFTLPLLLGAILGLFARRLDVLTMVVAVGTTVLWTLNYPLLQMLADLGNSPQKAVFAGWAGLVLVAIWFALREKISQMRPANE